MCRFVFLIASPVFLPPLPLPPSPPRQLWCQKGHLALLPSFLLSTPCIFFSSPPHNLPVANCWRFSFWPLQKRLSLQLSPLLPPPTTSVAREICQILHVAVVNSKQAPAGQACQTGGKLFLFFFSLGLFLGYGICQLATLPPTQMLQIESGGWCPLAKICRNAFQWFYSETL